METQSSNKSFDSSFSDPQNQLKSATIHLESIYASFSELPRLPEPELSSFVCDSKYYLTQTISKSPSGYILEGLITDTEAPIVAKLLHNGSEASKEIGILQDLNTLDTENQYVVPLLDYFSEGDWIYLIFPRLSQNLYEVLQNTEFQGLNLEYVEVFGWQLLVALEILDSAGVIHGDIKPENIMLKSAEKTGIELIDFGNAIRVGEGDGRYRSSLYYRSPEMLLDEGCSSASDVWSLGCVLAELYTGIPLFPGQDEEEQLEIINRRLGCYIEEKKDRNESLKMFVLEYTENYCESLVDLLEKMLEKDPEKRISPKEALDHEFFNFEASRCGSPESSMSKISTLESFGSPVPLRLKSCGALWTTPSSKSHSRANSQDSI